MPIHVLLIEDNRPDALLVQASLRKHGLDFTLNEITDAEMAAVYVEGMGKAAGAPRPDIVLMDLNLPRGDGLEVLEAIRKRPECASTPVIVMTSSESPNDRAKVAEMGNTRYL